MSSYRGTADRPDKAKAITAVVAAGHFDHDLADGDHLLFFVGHP